MERREGNGIRVRSVLSKVDGGEIFGRVVYIQGLGTEPRYSDCTNMNGHTTEV